MLGIVGDFDVCKAWFLPSHSLELSSSANWTANVALHSELFSPKLPYFIYEFVIAFITFWFLLCFVCACVHPLSPCWISRLLQALHGEVGISSRVYFVIIWKNLREDLRFYYPMLIPLIEQKLDKYVKLKWTFCAQKVDIVLFTVTLFAEGNKQPKYLFISP